MAKKKSKARRPAAARKERKIDIDNEDAVLHAMSRELDIPVEDLNIEADREYGSFTNETVWEVSTSGGHKRWAVVASDDVAEEIAKAVVRQDLENEPEIFNRDFIESHIDLDRLRRELTSDVEESNRESVEDEAKRRPIEFMKENGIDIPSPTKAEIGDYVSSYYDDEEADEKRKWLEEMDDPEDQWAEMGSEPEVSDSAIEGVIEDITKNQLRDPMDYLRDIYGDEAGKRAIEIAGLDIDAAVDEAVSTDGVGHFISRYDGHMHDGPGGLVYWRSH